MRVEDLLPEVYYKESRDFAYIGRCLELIVNYMKTAADCVLVNVDNEYVDSNMVELLVDTLGFTERHEYINKDLIYIISAFTALLKNKGSKTAINSAIRLLLNSQGIKKTASYDGNFYVFTDSNGQNQIEIRIPEELKDIVLLEDLFDYILPIGMLYTFIRVSISAGTQKTSIVEDSSLIEEWADGDTPYLEDNIHRRDIETASIYNAYIYTYKRLDPQGSAPEDWDQYYSNYYQRDPAPLSQEDVLNPLESYTFTPITDDNWDHVKNNCYKKIAKTLDLGTIDTGTTVTNYNVIVDSYKYYGEEIRAKLDDWRIYYIKDPYVDSETELIDETQSGSDWMEITARSVLDGYMSSIGIKVEVTNNVDLDNVQDNIIYKSQKEDLSDKEVILRKANIGTPSTPATPVIVDSLQGLKVLKLLIDIKGSLS